MRATAAVSRYEICYNLPDTELVIALTEWRRQRLAERENAMRSRTRYSWSLSFNRIAGKPDYRKRKWLIRPGAGHHPRLRQFSVRVLNKAKSRVRLNLSAHSPMGLLQTDEWQPMEQVLAGSAQDAARTCSRSGARKDKDTGQLLLSR
jgi:hypothetical protein